MYQYRLRAKYGEQVYRILQFFMIGWFSDKTYLIEFKCWLYLSQLSSVSLWRYNVDKLRIDQFYIRTITFLRFVSAVKLFEASVKEGNIDIKE